MSNFERKREERNSEEQKIEELKSEFPTLERGNDQKLNFAVPSPDIRPFYANTAHYFL